MSSHTPASAYSSSIDAPPGADAIGFIGVGKIGLPMARHLHRGGHRLSAFDASRERLALAAQAELPIARSLETLVREVDIVVTSLPHDVAFEAVAHDVAALARPGQLFVDTSTVSLAASQRVARAFDEAQVAYLRVTISGNPQMVEQGQLTSIASGRVADYERVLPLLRLLGPSHFHVGTGDEARVMKFVINLMVAGTAALLAEGLALGAKGGLGWTDMWRVIASSAVASPVVKAKATQLEDFDFSPTFTVGQMQKDVGLILDSAASFHAPLPVTSLVAQSLQSAVAIGLANEDYATIIKVARLAAGLPLDAHGESQ